MIDVMVVGLPGSMATCAAKRIIKEKDIQLIPYSITGNDIDDEFIELGNTKISLIREKDNVRKSSIINKSRPFIAVDYTEPNAVHKNIEYYCRNDIHFIMGTTGVVINKIKQNIAESNICAIIAPNMAKQIVALQAMLEYASNMFPNSFNNYTLNITESHQKSKLDTSGTARAMIQYFNMFGIPFDESMINKIRNPIDQMKIGIPDEAIEGHGWHKYTMLSSDKTVHIEITHNVNGREIYANGTVDSIYYLNGKINSGEVGKIFSMIDVLKKA